MDKRSWRQRRRHKQPRHDCRGRKRGQPKLGTGICRGLDSRPSLVERRRSRRLARDWVAALREREADDVEL